MKTLDEFMTECPRTTHRLSCYSPLPSHAAQVRILYIFYFIINSIKGNISFFL